MAELKPCPFCGCAMRVHSNREWHYAVGQHDDGCLLVDSDFRFPANDAGRADLLETWNRRATDGQRAGVPEGWEWPAVVREKLARFAECVEDGEGVDIGRDWLDALTTIGLLARVQRSPAMWEMTAAGEAMLAAAPTPPAGDIPTDSIDRLTREKAAHIIARDGFRVSGVVLTKPGGNACIVDKSAVRWLDSQELFRVMHPDAPPAGVAGQERVRGVDACANCLRPKAEHTGNACPRPYTTVWHPWDYDTPPAAIAASKGEKDA